MARLIAFVCVSIVCFAAGFHVSTKVIDVKGISSWADAQFYAMNAFLLLNPQLIAFLWGALIPRSRLIATIASCVVTGMLVVTAAAAECSREPNAGFFFLYYVLAAWLALIGAIAWDRRIAQSTSI